MGMFVNAVSTILINSLNLNEMFNTRGVIVQNTLVFPDNIIIFFYFPYCSLGRTELRIMVIIRMIEIERDG